ncbi:MAG: ferredoxin [Sphingobacteriia bacterium]|nr:ferredoxin [Sphingobacteriia bacterium]NCC38726.1 ferredoxin [Gammaproteobacteria bacterium]
MISKVEVEEAACIGCGTCWVACPQAFSEHDMGDDLKAVATGALGDQHFMRSAAEGCPTLAISLIDENGVMLFPTEEARAALRATTDW